MTEPIYDGGSASSPIRSLSAFWEPLFAPGVSLRTLDRDVNPAKGVCSDLSISSSIQSPPSKLVRREASQEEADDRQLAAEVLVRLFLIVFRQVF